VQISAAAGNMPLLRLLLRKLVYCIALVAVSVAQSADNIYYLTLKLTISNKASELTSSLLVLQLQR
jgi:hypothetical protein